LGENRTPTMAHGGVEGGGGGGRPRSEREGRREKEEEERLVRFKIFISHVNRTDVTIVTGGYVMKGGWRQLCHTRRHDSVAPQEPT
jgi:hypothetical protein